MNQRRFRYRPRLPADVRFWRRVNVASGDECWIWIGACDRDGYGLFLINANDEHDGRRICMHAQRFAWTLFNSPIIGDLHVLHHCDNPACVNPAHLFLGTNADNVADRDRKGRTVSGWHTQPDRMRQIVNMLVPPRMLGEANPSAKLTSAAVQAIRADQRPSRAIANEYRVSKTVVNAIRRGELWREVTNQ